MRYASSRTTGRRGTALASSAAALCLGALLSGCGAGGDGYVAAGAAGPDGQRSAEAVPPKGGVDLVPLDEDGTGNDRDGKGGLGGKRDQGASGPAATGDGNADGPASRAPSASARAPGRTDGPGRGKGGSGAPGNRDDDPKGDEPGKPSPSGPGSDPSNPSGSPTPTGPAVLEVGKPERTATDERWCEKVKVEFRNTGGSAVASGTVTFSTHVIDLLGIDWATLKSEEELPAPIGAGQKKEKTWTVCVDDWRVPLGMRIETKDVSVTWKP